MKKGERGGLAFKGMGSIVKPKKYVALTSKCGCNSTRLSVHDGQYRLSLATWSSSVYMTLPTYRKKKEKKEKICGLVVEPEHITDEVWTAPHS